MNRDTDRPSVRCRRPAALLLRRNSRLALALIILVVLFGIYAAIHPRGLSTYVLTIWANQGVGLALPAVAQTAVVLTSGIDLSVGGIFSLANCVASEIVHGSALAVALGVVLVLVVGLACGLVNGLVVVYGRIQPIIATLATGSVFTGLALFLRPVTGGEISEGLSDALTYDVVGVPTSLLLVCGLLLLVWRPFKATKLGRGMYAVGSSELAAYMSGVRTKQSKIAAYMFAGLFAALGGLFVGLQTLTGDASIGVLYTMNSIAATVLGGTSLAGGVGGPFGSVLGAFILRTISSIMFFSGVPPLAQPFFEGLVLLGALSMGAIRLINVRNRLELIG